MDQILEVGSHGLTAILATWLGVTVVSRARGQHASRVFGWLSLLLAFWSTSIVVERLSADPVVARVFNDLEDVAAFLLPAATLHIVLAFTVEAWPSRGQRVALLVAYAVSALLALQAIVDPEHPVNVDAPHLELFGIPGAVLGWAWIVFRVAIFALAIFWSYQAFAGARGDAARRGQTGAALATVTIAALGGTLRLLPEAFGGPKWVGVSIVTGALLLATYAVLAEGVFLAPRAARQAYRSSLLGGLAVAAYVGGLIGVETLARNALHLEIPIFTALIVVATIGLFDPIRGRLSRIFVRRSSEEVAYHRLERALDPNALASQAPEVSIQPAIERVARVLGISGAVVATSAGEVVARHGAAPSDTPGMLAVPLQVGGRLLGNALFGPKRTGAPYSTAESDLLDEAADYIAASLDLGERQTHEAAQLSELGTHRAAVARRGIQLDEALGRVSPVEVALRVWALGPLRVERNGTEIRQWGGPKAGSRQAEAVFAFLFDRGDRGASKDEIIEVIWPDVDLGHADLAFHRTLVGLRGLLEPGRAPRGHSTAVSFHNDRYRLDPRLVAWSDLAVFGERMAAAGAAQSAAAAIAALEEARTLYRGDLLDDCPFYGDSEYVEEHRRLMRGRYVDLLVTLGERYEAQADRPSSASAFREALSAAGGACPPAEQGLERLGATP